MNTFEIIEEFKAAIRIKSGIEPPETIKADGVLHRFHIKGDKLGSKNGAYTLHLDGHPAGFFENHKTGVRFNWKSGKKAKALSKEENQKLASIQYETVIKQEQRYEQAALKAQELINRSTSAADVQHPYLEHKKVNAYDLKVLPIWQKREQKSDGSGFDNIIIKNVLIVKLVDINGKICNVQAIFPETDERLGRNKDFLPGGRLRGLFHPIGQPGDEILICEGFATGASLYQATGKQTLCAMSASNLLKVAKIIRNNSPGKKIIICADNDANKQANVGLNEAKKAAMAVGGFLATPPIPGDFNDLANIVNSPYSIATIINNAHPINEKFELDRYANHRIDDFSIFDGGMLFWRRIRSHEVPIKLMANAVLLIKEEILLDDGILPEIVFKIEGKQKNGNPLHPVMVPASQFNNMQWLIKRYGTQAVMEPDQATFRRLSIAIIKLSGIVPRITVYQHSGWRLIDNEWCYLTGSGAIGEQGLNRDVRVDLGFGNLQHYQLPAPPGNPTSVIGHMLSVLRIAPRNPAIGVSIFCSVIRAILVECLPVNFALFMYGKTGSFKSQCAALALSFFGKFNSSSLTASFIDSPTSLELASHKTKDSIWVVDDLKPAVSQSATNERYALAETLFSGMGNHTARNKCNSDSTAKSPYYPRCLLLSNGEELPKGTNSLLGRMLVFELKEGDIKKELLDNFQVLAESGHLAESTSAFIQWLAPHMDSFKRSFPNTVRDLLKQTRDKNFSKSHPRASEIYANLFAAADVFITYAVEVGAITNDSAEEYIENIDMSLQHLMKAQQTYQNQRDEVNRFCDILRSCFVSGDCHVCDHLTQGPPIGLSHVWGWRSPSEGADVVGRGQPIGWINQLKNELWLDGDSAFKVVQRFASAQNEAILMQKSTIFKHLLERGTIIESEIDAKSGKSRPDVKRSAGGKRCRVLVFKTDFITVGDDDPS